MSTPPKHKRRIIGSAFFLLIITIAGALAYISSYPSSQPTPTIPPDTVSPTHIKTTSPTSTTAPQLTSTYTPNIKAKISLSSLCYNGPSENYTQLIMLPKNSDVDVLGTSSDDEAWFAIKVSQAGSCWIKADRISPRIDSQQVPKVTTAITTADSFCYQYPSNESTAYTYLRTGWRVTVYGKNNDEADWVFVTHPETNGPCWFRRKQLTDFDYTSLSLILRPPISTITETPNATLTLRAEFDDADLQYKVVKGNMVYIVPKEMKVGEEFDIQLILQPFESPMVLITKMVKISGLPTSIGAPGTLVSPIGTIIIEPKPVNVSKFMKATLTSVNPDTLIVSDYLKGDDAIQDVSSTEPTRWHWKITAKKEGTTKLILVIARLVKFEQDNIWHEVDSHTETITVKVTALQYLQRLFKELNPLEILIGAVSAIIVGVVIPLLLTKIREGRKRSKTETSKKYLPLQQFLLMQPKDRSEIILSFADIERVIDDTLPHSAEKIGWWLGEAKGKLTHKNAWLKPGWRVDNVDLTDRKVTFMKQDI